MKDNLNTLCWDEACHYISKQSDFTIFNWQTTKQAKNILSKIKA